MPHSTRKTVAVLFALCFLFPCSVVLSSAQNPQNPANQSKPSAIELKKRNPAFLISVESVLQKINEKQEIALVDVRRKEEFEKFRIPGSVNIPLFAIKTKPFLRSTPLVLINEGYSYRGLEQECEHLNKIGFRAWILNGGLYYWKQKSAPLQGDAFSLMALNKVPPDVFFLEKDYDNWLLIDVSQTKNSQVGSIFPKSIYLPHENNEQKFLSSIKKTLRQRKDNPFLMFLVFNQKGENYYKI
ncbi:MAG TPA: rhodanese-like domain-containing protein, partial [Desulfobacterales bacterium]|nr:rhodanese-like domain-containing protein [Desulfobacterales bacterium]